MKITVYLNDKFYKHVDVQAVESDVWKSIAKSLLEIHHIPSVLKVSCIYGNAVLLLQQRGAVASFSGHDRPSLYVVLKSDTMTQFLKRSIYKERYLTCINPAGNNYKFYHLIPINKDNMTIALQASYGRIAQRKGEQYGERSLKEPYPSQLYWIRYYEKLSKGYVDESAYYLSNTTNPIRPYVPKNDNERLYDQLMHYAWKIMQKTFLDWENISEAQIHEAEKLYRTMQESYTLYDFNAALMKFLMLAPRKIVDVRSVLASCNGDIPMVLAREEGILNSMKATYEGKNTEVHSFEKYGIFVHLARSDEKRIIMDLIDPTMQESVKKIWIIDDVRQLQKFISYCQKREIQDTRYLIHGSRIENWFSIVQNRLLLPYRNQAEKTGNSLGNGLYFANSSFKSSHYTFGEDAFILGIYEVAYGNPMEILDEDHNAYSFHTRRELDQKGYTVIHYHRKNVSWADEIVTFYEESAVLKAIVLFQA